MTASDSTAVMPAITRCPIPVPASFSTTTGRALRKSWRNCWGLISPPTMPWAELCNECDLIDDARLK